MHYLCIFQDSLEGLIVDVNVREKLDAFLAATMEKGIVVDGSVAQDSTQAASFWQLREVCSHLRFVKNQFLPGT